MRASSRPIHESERAALVASAGPDPRASRSVIDRLLSIVGLIQPLEVAGIRWDALGEALRRAERFQTLSCEVERAWWIQIPYDFTWLMVETTEGEFVLLREDFDEGYRTYQVHRGLEIALRPPDSRRVHLLSWSGEALPGPYPDLEVGIEEVDFDGDPAVKRFDELSPRLQEMVRGA